MVLSRRNGGTPMDYERLPLSELRAWIETHNALEEEKRK
jgi:hypothetical protein